MRSLWGEVTKKSGKEMLQWKVAHRITFSFSVHVSEKTRRSGCSFSFLYRLFLYFVHFCLSVPCFCGARRLRLQLLCFWRRFLFTGLLWSRFRWKSDENSRALICTIVENISVSVFVSAIIWDERESDRFWCLCVDFFRCVCWGNVCVDEVKPCWQGTDYQ